MLQTEQPIVPLTRPMMSMMMTVLGVQKHDTPSHVTKLGVQHVSGTRQRQRTIADKRFANQRIVHCGRYICFSNIWCRALMGTCSNLSNRNNGVPDMKSYPLVPLLEDTSGGKLQRHKTCLLLLQKKATWRQRYASLCQILLVIC